MSQIPTQHVGSRPSAIMVALAEWIPTVIPGANPDTVIVTQTPDEEPPNTPSLRYWTITWADGKWDEGLFAGGGRETALDETRFVIGLYDGSIPVRQAEDKAALLRQTGSVEEQLFALAQGVVEWMPVDPVAPGFGLLAEPLWPIGYESPKRLQGNYMRSRLTLRARFLWSLGALPSG